MSVIFGEFRTFPQGEGPDVRLRVIGDEFYARYETDDGYTVVYDPAIELYCYAVLIRGHLASSGIPLTKRPPTGVRRHLQEAKEIRNDKFRKRLMEVYPPEIPPVGIMRTRGTHQGLLPGRRISEGKVTGLTVLVEFSDVQSGIDFGLVNEMLNGEHFTGARNFCSVRQYFLMMSGGKLDYTNVVVGPVRLPRSRAYYITHSFIKEALDRVVHELGVDLSQFDSQAHGIVDAVNFLYAGRSVYENKLWPHNWRVDLAAGQPLVYNGIRFNQYMMTGLGRRPVDLAIGTFCHETGHLLCRFPDLYDYGSRDGDSDPSAGLGVYCLMASGNHLDYGRTPSPVCAYLRDLVGWPVREVLLNAPGAFEARHGDYGTVLRFETDRPNEYFLVENRSRIGLDAHLPADGMAVYHCDTLGSNEWQGGTADRHYQCALIQADGALHLETNRNTGDAGDLFAEKTGVVLSHDTLPHSRAWDGTDTGFNLMDVGLPGEMIRFRTGKVSDQGGNDISDAPLIYKETLPDLLIPDDDPEGLISVLSVAPAGTVKDILVAVDISHTFVGDLEVSLTPPGGAPIILHNREWGSRDDLRAEYDLASRLGPLKGSPVQGDWTLKIRDLAQKDIGRLNAWRLMIEYTPSVRVVQGEATCGLRIPDADWSGITSVIPVDQEGLARDIQVHVEIRHGYIGDLQIALIAPSGQGVVLLGFGEGGNKADVRRTYQSADHDRLAAMVRAGQPMRGDWTLQVIDNTPGDTGVLEKWSIALTC